jgi:hypothetical protein
MVRGMPVPCRDDHVEVARRGELVDAPGDPVAPGDGERAVGRIEVVLVVDDDQRAAHG